MSRQIQAVYENGVIRPLEPVQLAEGEVVEHNFDQSASEKPSHVGRNFSGHRQNLKRSTRPTGFPSEQHDRIFYPNEER